MTLCISLARADGSILCLADSRLTLESGDKTWQSDMAVKIAVATQETTFYPADRFDVVFSVSGTLSLGLQSILYIDACLKGESNSWSDGIIALIQRKLWDFWDGAISKTVSYSIAMHDHKRKPRLFEWQHPRPAGEPAFQEIPDLNGILLSVHGDGAALVRQKILAEVQATAYCGLPIQDVLTLSSIRALQAAICDKSRPYIGGEIQACLLSTHIADQLVCQHDGDRYLRSAWIEDFDGRAYGSLNLDHPWLDPSQPLLALVAQSTVLSNLIVPATRLYGAG